MNHMAGKYSSSECLYSLLSSFMGICWQNCVISSLAFFALSAKCWHSWTSSWSMWWRFLRRVFQSVGTSKSRQFSKSLTFFHVLCTFWYSCSINEWRFHALVRSFCISCLVSLSCFSSCACLARLRAASQIFSRCRNSIRMLLATVMVVLICSSTSLYLSGNKRV